MIRSHKLYLNKVSKKIFGFFLLIPFLVSSQDSLKTKISVIGTLHFNQFHDPKIESKNFLGSKRQQEFDDLILKLSKFHADMVMVEREPRDQHMLDSLFELQLNSLGQELSDGRSEVYQIGFRLAKKENLGGVFGIDYYESISQKLLNSGENLDLFSDQLEKFQTLGRSVTSNFLSGNSTITDLLLVLNARENIALSHNLLFNIPAYVVNGTFKTNKGIDTPIDEGYIGAEFISLFYERNLKIYSNIINTCLKEKPQRVIVIIGQVHVGVLESLIENNPNFELIESGYLLE